MMRKPILGITLLAALPLVAAEWMIDAAHSAAQFSVRHLMVSNVRGHFGKMTGSAVYDPANLAHASVEATIEVGSIDTREPKRDAHLKSPDFFEAEKFPTMTFKSTKVEPAGAGKAKMTGLLTIKGITKEVVFDVEGPSAPIKDQRGMERIGAAATTKISRKEFGLTWNRLLETGGAVVGDEVTIILDVELVKRAPKT